MPRERSDQECECGCGERTFITPCNDRSKGWVKGEPFRWLHLHHPRTGRSQTVGLPGETFRETENRRRRERYDADVEYREKRLAEGRAAYAGNPEPKRVRNRGWWKHHREEGQMLARARRARKRAVLLEPVVRLVVLERDDGLCGICGEDVDPNNFDIDHVIPLVGGGWHAYDNVQVAHPICNRRKGAR